MSQNSNFQIVEDLNDQQLIAYTSKKVIAVDTELHGLKMLWQGLSAHRITPLHS